jgi:hypothetical protein
MSGAMTLTMTLPAALSVRNMLEDLLGREITVSHVGPLVGSDIAQTVVAVYVDRNLQLAAVLGLELKLAANAGAALGLMPPGAVEDSLNLGTLTAMLAENVGELCNVFTGLLNRDDAPHVKLYQVFEPGDLPPADVTANLVALGRRMDLHVDVARYGGGKLSVALVA